MLICLCWQTYHGSHIIWRVLKERIHLNISIINVFLFVIFGCIRIYMHSCFKCDAPSIKIRYWLYVNIKPSLSLSLSLSLFEISKLIPISSLPSMSQTIWTSSQINYITSANWLELIPYYYVWNTISKTFVLIMIQLQPLFKMSF